MTQFSDLVGQTLKIVRNADDEVIFITADGVHYRMYHDQNCCESVRLYDVEGGELGDLVGEPVLYAYEDTSREHPEEIKECNLFLEDSFLWTFYRIGTVKGSCVLRWLGTSNGYYSETVSFERMNG